MKIAYIFICAIIVFIMILSSWFTSKGTVWYRTLRLPSFTPPNWVFSVVWAIIYLLVAISAILWWDSANQSWYQFIMIGGLFLINGFLNCFWSYLFFHRHMMSAPIAVSIGMEVTLMTLIYLLWPINWLAAVLLIPYALWIVFATFLTIVIWWLN